jgi:hypothetical protein
MKLRLYGAVVTPAVTLAALTTVSVPTLAASTQPGNPIAAVQGVHNPAQSVADSVTADNTKVITASVATPDTVIYQNISNVNAAQQEEIQPDQRAYEM